MAAEGMPEGGGEPIAIVGMACKVPGADNIRDFWRVLLHGENHVTDVPPSRWNVDAFYDPDPNTAGKGYVRKAGLVNHPEEFDNKVYGINDYEAAQMDPQQRFVLDCTLMALEDAGLTRASIAGSNTGVFVGVSNSDYRVLFRSSSSGVNGYTVTGISNSIIAARVSYIFDLRGPSLVLDTACSSSLIGIHLACQAIRAGDCSMAIAGGTNYLTLPDVFVHLCKAGMMSPTGQCHAFGSDADGYVRGEGCGIVILKSLRDAERDGDKIWATVYTGSNQDGHTVSPLTAPSGIQQQSLLNSVASKIHLDLDRIDYIEAHGTGTSAGDPVEAQALGEFFRTQTAASRPPRYVGSVKTNIGHLESAAGVVGVIKVLLMMKHNMIVPSLHCKEANPLINFADLRLTVPGKPVIWETPDKVAYCNSFGFGGSNSHAVLYQYRERENPGSDVALKSDRPCVVAVSACTEKSLRGMVEELHGEVGRGELHVHDLSWTSTARRDHYPVRKAHVVHDLQDLAAALEDDLARPQVGTAVYKRPKVTFVFGGMGTCWPGMCRELIDQIPVFLHTIMQVEEELKTYVEWSLSERLREDFDPQDPLFSPIAIFACQVALAAVWRDLGLEAQSIVGQSVGEVGAAHVAGCLTMGEAVGVVYHRSRLLAAVSGGRMIVVRNVPVAKTKQVVNRYGDKASISLYYSPTACCISVSREILEEVRADLSSSLHTEHRDVHLSELHVPVAYHSAHVEPCMDPLREALAGLQPRPPTVPLISSVTGLRITEAPDADYWVSNLRKPVLFDQAVLQSRTSQSRQLFVEIGPKPVLRAHLADIFPKADVMAVTSMSKPPEFKVFLQALTSVYEFGADIQWARLPSLSTTLTDIPRYVLDTKKNLMKSEAAVLWLSGVDEGRSTHPFLFPLTSPANSFKIVISSAVLPSIYDHVVGGRVLVPGAVYAETGLAVGSFLTSDQRWSVSVDLEQAAVIPKDGYLDLDLDVQVDPEVTGVTEVRGQQNSRDCCTIPITVRKDDRTLAHIRISKVMSDQPPTDLINVQHVLARCPDKVGKDVIYGALRHAGFMYGEAFTQLEDAYASDDECLCTLRVHPTVLKELRGTTIHPAVLDCMIQSSLLVTGKGSHKNKSKDLLPKALGRLLVHRRPSEPVMLVHTRLKAVGVKQKIYDLKLMTTSGLVLVELEGLVINLIMETEENHLEHTYLTTWSHVTPLPPPAGLPEEEDSGEIILLADRMLEGSEVKGDSKVKVMDVQGMDFTHGMPAVLQQFVTSNRKASALVLLCLERPSERADADTIDAHMVNTSFLYKELLTVANRLSLSMPLYLCTRYAWPSPSSRGLELPVNPAATGLWGLCRTVMSERIYPDTRCVEVQLSEDTLTLPYLATLVTAFNTHPELNSHAELLVNADGIYASQVVSVDPSSSVPMFRVNSLGPRESAMLLSQESSAVVTPHAVLYDVTSSSAGREGQEVTHIRVQEFAVQNASLMRWKMPYERLDQSRASKTSGCPVFAVEVLGSIQRSTALDEKTHRPSAQNGNTQKALAQKGKTQTVTAQNGKTQKAGSKNGKTQKLNGKIQNSKGEAASLVEEVYTESDTVVSCYPVAMGTQVAVPSCVTLPTSLLPGYQPGDLTKLVVLFELQAKVDSPGVTILTSSTTQHYAEVLQEMLKGRRHGKVPYVTSVVMADRLHVQKTAMHDTVISLLMLDGDLMASLLDSWTNAKTLVTCSSLLQSDALSCAGCFAEDLELVVVDTQLLFQPSCLKARVPRVAQWLRERRAGASSLVSSLHQDLRPQSGGQLDTQDDRVVRDLSDLLQFHTSQMTQLKVQVTKEQLFRKDSTYLVVGGLSGLGWLCVEYLAERHAGCIAILNRRHPSPQQTDNMAALVARHHCHVTAFQGDVTSLASVTSVLKQIEAAFPESALKGIFFGAAVTADKSFLTMDVPGFDSALSPKVRGTWNLHTLTRNLPLDYFVMHSSIASVMGNAGQANYATGNAFMDGLAHHRRQLGLCAQSVNWGVLDLGILSHNDTARTLLEARGFLLMAEAEIRHVLTSILMVNWPQCVPVRLDRERLSQRMYREASPRLISRLQPILTQSVQEVEEDLLQVVHTAQNCGPEERVSIYERYLQILVSRVLSVELSSVSLEVSLLELGMDSVGAMTLITQIHRDTSKRLTAVLLLTGHPTIVTLAEAINEAPDEEAGGEEREGTLKIEEIQEEEDKEEEEEASILETRQLRLYRDHPRPDLLHIVVDVQLKAQHDLSDLQTAANAALTLYPSARKTFTEVKGSSGVTFRRSRLLPTDPDRAADVRVVVVEGGDGGGGGGGRGEERVDAETCERLDLERCGPVRFLLVDCPAGPFVRMVMHKVAFDTPYAAQFAEDVLSCLESPGCTPVGEREPQDPDVKWHQTLLDDLRGNVGAHVSEYWADKLSEVHLGSTSFVSGHRMMGGGERRSEVESVGMRVSALVVQRVKAFLETHNITLMGVLASCYQVMLHALTGQDTIPLLFLLDLRKVHGDVSRASANCCSELPLLADFGAADRTAMTLQSFILNNSQGIMQDIQHGGLPLFLLESLTESLQSVLGDTSHGVTIDQLSQSDNASHSIRSSDVAASSSSSSSSLKKLKLKQALKFAAPEGAVVLPLGLETNLTIRHLLHHDALTLILTFKRSALTQMKARVLLSELVSILMRLITHQATSLSKIAQRGSRLKRCLQKPVKKVEKC